MGRHIICPFGECLNRAAVEAQHHSPLLIAGMSVHWEEQGMQSMAKKTSKLRSNPSDTSFSCSLFWFVSSLSTPPIAALLPPVPQEAPLPLLPLQAAPLPLLPLGSKRARGASERNSAIVSTSMLHWPRTRFSQ
jgi:hypothetical protein